MSLSESDTQVQALSAACDGSIRFLLLEMHHVSRAADIRLRPCQLVITDRKIRIGNL